MSNNLGFSSRATFNEKLVKIKHKLEVEELDAKHSNIEFSNEPDQNVEITHDESVHAVFTEEGDLTIVNGALHCRKIVMNEDVPWFTEAFYQYYIFTENDTLISGNNSNLHLIYPTQTFRSTGNIESIFTEFKVQTAPVGFSLAIGVVVASRRSSNDFTEVITGNNYFAVLNSTILTLVQDDIIKLELKTNNNIHVYQNGVQRAALGYSQLFTNLQNHNEGSDTVFSWYLVPQQTNNLNTFRLKLLDSWSESELHNESEIDIGTLLSIKQNNNDLVNIDSNSVDFEAPIHLKSISTITDMLALNNNIDASAIVWNNELKSACLFNGTHWEMLNRRAQHITVATSYYSKQYNSNTNFSNINDSFETTFTVLTPTYRIRFYAYVDDANSASQYFEARLIDNITGTPTAFSQTINMARFDESDEMALLMDFFISGLTVASVHQINIQGRTTIINDMITIKSGQNSFTEIYPKSYFEIIPLYNVSTF